MPNTTNASRVATYAERQKKLGFKLARAMVHANDVPAVMAYAERLRAARRKELGIEMHPSGPKADRWRNKLAGVQP